MFDAVLPLATIQCGVVPISTGHIYIGATKQCYDEAEKWEQESKLSQKEFSLAKNAAVVYPDSVPY